ncbi:Asp-tRNA(Asn)/Glu-tRNA(Gln) amidotransferase subunit GatC [Helicobacter aurati]|uniref:Aspartyl/glutamyl-tRNA(Asn/Gln) amidotransferase subunit C n=1 Tax=Helicobacter aurati TaxID=137778 RepID=A0A3D8J2N9_9HELI|nr:Asp-tRNA(Asn)/Glu-tRNA(Gln) amidotransferase subunit GatC [Helicobacter aurati]RDU71663.1 Asp-tRNA(Asn)/Glu-tRNA(Gln) amidotransferase subunit GatC [Helicobacter aurati]
MFVDELLLDKLERLAMIKIPKDKRESFQQELTEIIEKMNILQDIETDLDTSINVQQTLLRDDIPHNGSVAEAILAQAPDSQDNYFIVPRIIE